MRKIMAMAVTLLLWGTAALTGCISQKGITMVVSCEYNAEENTTDYMVVPFGKVSIPGKWERGRYLSNSHQQFFKNQDSTSIAISMALTDSYEFNHSGTLKGYDFAKAFYDWESEYLEKQKMMCGIEESDKENGYIIYKVTAEDDHERYFLYGERRGVAHNYLVSIPGKWDRDQTVKFLRDMFVK